MAVGSWLQNLGDPLGGAGSFNSPINSAMVLFLKYVTAAVVTQYVENKVFLYA